MNILFIDAIPDNGLVEARIDDQGEITINLGGSCNLWKFLAPSLSQFPNTFLERIIISANSRDIPLKIKAPILVFNEISEPDSHLDALKITNQIIDQLKCAVINSPASIMNTRREHLQEKLIEFSCFNVPKTIRMTPLSPKDISRAWKKYFPECSVIVRKAGDHGGKSTLKLSNQKDLSLLHQYSLDGSAYMMSEFINYRSPDQLYRKYRFVLVNGAVFLRHMIISDQWMVHSRSRSFMKQNPKYYDEEKEMLHNFKNIVDPGLLKSLSMLNQIFGAEYLGLDCHIDEDNILTVFELNAGMNILVNNQVDGQLWEEPIDQIKQALLKLIINKASSSIRLT